jgi:hypothetical protein
MNSVEVADQPGVFHIPAVEAQVGVVTICARSADVSHVEHLMIQSPVNCERCLDAMRQISQMKRGVLVAPGAQKPVPLYYKLR